jgi:hypothetical protein
MEMYIKLYDVVLEQLGTCGMATIVEKREILKTFMDNEEANEFVKNYAKPNSYVELYIVPHFEKAEKFGIKVD